jgi:mannose-1-phosphate guanylyltransferase/mannose-6-phosphate isomerase
MYPKQFIRFFNGQNGSFLSAAMKRLSGEPSFRPPILLCNNDHRFLVAEEVERAGLKPHAIILEPIARNTAPAIAVAALVALKDDPNAILAVMPSDHVVNDEARFAEGVKCAARIAATGK